MIFDNYFGTVLRGFHKFVSELFVKVQMSRFFPIHAPSSLARAVVSLFNFCHPHLVDLRSKEKPAPANCSTLLNILIPIGGEKS